MTDNEHPIGGGRDRAIDDGSPHVHGGWWGLLAHRWPAALGIAVAALTVYGLEDGRDLAALVVLMALVYVGSAALDRRRFAWVVLLAGVAVLAVVPSTSQVVASEVFLVAALVFVVLGAVRGQLRETGGLTLQAAGMLVFGAGMLAALYVAPETGAYLVAAGLLGHGAWDAVHYVRDGVVARSYAEFCAVLDLLVGVALLFILLVR